MPLLPSSNSSRRSINEPKMPSQHRLSVRESNAYTAPIALVPGQLTVNPSEEQFKVRGHSLGAKASRNNPQSISSANSFPTATSSLNSKSLMGSRSPNSIANEIGGFGQYSQNEGLRRSAVNNHWSRPSSSSLPGVVVT